MIKFFCDRCGQEIKIDNPYQTEVSSTIVRTIYVGRTDAVNHFKGDLCDDCEQTLKIILEENGYISQKA